VARVSEKSGGFGAWRPEVRKGASLAKAAGPVRVPDAIQINNLSTCSLLRQQHHHAAGGQAPIVTSTAHAKGPVRGLDFVIALILCAGRESKRTLRSINDDAASALVWVVDKLVKAYS
jgi:hypothetical protein